MDTWNIATVMAPNILRESNEKEMRNVDQGAVKVVFDLIENNDEFSEVRRSVFPLTQHKLTKLGSSRDYGVALWWYLFRHVCKRDHAAMGAKRQEPSLSSCSITEVSRRYRI
jgi:hypothetical protein